MQKPVSDLAKMAATVAIAVTAIAFLAAQDASLEGLASASSKGITISAIAVVVYERFLWRLNPFEKRPRLLGRYDCVLEYSHDKGNGCKKTTALIKQTLLTTSISFCTDEITSNTKASELVDESGRYVLYYTYLTTPLMKYSRKNPIQYGTCRLEVMDDGELRGSYWTSSATTGDIKLTRRL